MDLKVHGRYGYNKQTVNELVTDDGGIYMIGTGPTYVTFRRIYVGKAKNLKTRLLEHLSDGGVDTCIKKYVRENHSSFYYCYVNNERDRKNIEYTLYKQSPPECNEKVPEGEKIDIDFPC